MRVFHNKHDDFQRLILLKNFANYLKILTKYNKIQLNKTKYNEMQQNSTIFNKN